MTRKRTNREGMPHERMFPNKWMDLFTTEELSIQERLVWRVLNEFQWSNDVAFPSQKTLAKVCGIGDRQIRRVVESLERKGMLIVVHNRKVGRTNNYTVVVPEGIQDRIQALHGVTEDAEKGESYVPIDDDSAENESYVDIDDPEI